MLTELKQDVAAAMAATSASTYTVTYDGNGNTGGNVPLDGKVYAAGQTVSVLENSGNLAKTGFSFDSWNSKADGSGTFYVPGTGQFSMPTNAVVLYAQWASSLPAVPTDVSGIGGAGKVTLSWQAAARASSYKVYYKAGATATTSDAQAPSAMISGTGAVIAGLSNGVLYAFVVVASNSIGDSESSGVATATPAATSNGFEASTGDGTVALTWPPSPEATGYSVYYAQGSTVTKGSGTKVVVTVTSATITGLTNGTQYAFLYAPIAGNTEGAASAVSTVTPGTTPTQVSVSVTDSTATLSWTPVIGASSYTVYYANASSATSASTKLSAGMISGTTATISGLNNSGTPYSFALTYTSGVESSVSSVVQATPVAAPTVSLATGSLTSTLSWPTVAGALSYDLYWSSSPGVTRTSTKIANVTSPYTHSSLTAGQSYFYAVVANNPASESALSAEKNGTAVILAPTGLVVAGHHLSTRVSWTPVDGATSYNLYWSDTSGVSKSSTKITGATGPYVHPNLSDGTTYYYAVTAVNGSYESPISAEASAMANYAIGDTGPGGGLIFYAPAVGFSEGSIGTVHYLEAAPADQSTGIMWYAVTPLTIVGARNLGIGGGKPNTDAIISAQGVASYAAAVCTGYSNNDKSDWFLPSKDELNLMYSNLYANSMGGFAYDRYWSSSQATNGYDWFQYFNGGGQTNNYGSTSCYVRAIRAF